jgi:glycosyltransferase involved in cell wall biosynthesis
MIKPVPMSEENSHMHTDPEERLVSVVIPAYNCGKYIVETLESVLAQTYRNFEIVVVDDGSTDNTKEVLEPYFDEIVYHYQQNGGLAAARNKGLSLAKGEYFALLDADDIWVPNKLELQLKCFDLYPEVGLVFSEFSAFNTKGTISPSYSKIYFEFIFQNYKLTLDKIFEQKKELDDKRLAYAGNICETEFLGNIIMPSTTIIKRECIEKIGMFPGKYKNDGDYDLFLRITQAYKCGFIDMPLMKYRVLENSLSQRSQKEGVGVSEVIDIIETFVRNSPVFAKEKIELIKQRFAGLHYEMGYGHFSRNNYNEARKSFIKSFRHHVLPLASSKVYLFLIVTLLPRGAILLLKYWKNFPKILSAGFLLPSGMRFLYEFPCSLMYNPLLCVIYDLPINL